MKIMKCILGADGMCQHCNKSGKTVDYLATRCEKMLGHGYTRRHNEVVRCLHLLLLNRYKFKSSKRIRSHSVQKILDNEYAEIRVNTRIKTDVKIRNNRPDIFILDKKKNKMTLIEVGITFQDSLQIVETEKLRKYDLLANKLGLIYKCSVEIIPYVMTWDGIVTKYHKSHLKRLEIPMNYLRRSETISFDRRRGLESGLNAEESWERASMCVIMRSEMHEEPTPPLKGEKREEDGVKILKPKNKTPPISQGGTTLEEPTNNINEESDLEEETIVVKEIILKIKEISTRRTPKVETTNKTQLAIIKSFLKVKHMLEAEINKTKNLIQNYIARKNEFVGVMNQNGKKEDHLAARLIRFLHLFLKRCKFMSTNCFGSHSGRGIFDNVYAEIELDTRVKIYAKFGI
ncbi:hypothetical protein CWI38_1945p0030 [Hamiltosporidium tvaerminnensis]|uniref:Reverse transcriptase n=1 Tax=Hamiltosporidium tvaerminnensis TaxID=1176355 RepID=A0A4V2JX28_9MICR|nr:hypothetical protein CWI38_1945p0030 [Hamiltosporidium tvaerminnensis]